MSGRPEPRLASPLLECTYAVFDFETTGLSPAKGSEVVETGVARVERGTVTATYEELSRPLLPIPAGATGIHGITDDMVADRPHFSLLLPGLIEFLGDAVLVAHNAPFDCSFLDAALRHAGLPDLPNPVLDTVRLSRRLFPDFERHDLESLCTAHRIPRDRGHRALDDARATAALLGHLLERAAELEIRTLGELLEIGRPGRRGGGPGGAGGPGEITISEEEQIRLEDALTTGDRVRIRYVSAHGNRSDRTIVPYQLDASGAVPRLIARDLDKDATRTFRLDRITAVDRPAEEGEGR